MLTANRSSIIDSHVHLYAADHLPNLNWSKGLSEHHTLNQQRSLNEYCEDAVARQQVSGIIVVEADRKFSHDPDGWKAPLAEIRYVVAVAKQQFDRTKEPSALHAPLILGIVPWAPVAVGAAAVDAYLEQVRQLCSDLQTFPLIKGFRYLVQDKPRSTMVSTDFIAGVRRLGELHLTFDLGVDARSGGLWQLEEACAMLHMVYAHGSSVTVVINHFCKPNLLRQEKAFKDLADFSKWSACIREMASFPSTYMKLSGLFSEMPLQEGDPTPLHDLVRRIKPWAEVVFEAFTPSRIMFGSDWPVCTVNGPGSRSWQHWHDVVTLLLTEMELTEAEQQQVWSGTAIKAYRIK